MTRSFLLFCLAVLAIPAIARSQQPVVTVPGSVTTVTGGGGTPVADNITQINGTAVSDTNGLPAKGNTGFADSNTALGGGLTFTGLARTMPVWGVYFQCRAYSDQAGTLNVLQSDDSGSTYHIAGTTAITAATYQLVRVTTTGVPGTTLYQCQVVNGATPETVLRLTSSETAN